jgi:hypothetical protein
MVLIEEEVVLILRGPGIFIFKYV